MTPAELDPEVRRDLRGLQKETAESVARHLVAAGLLVDEDPARALEHARYARRRAARIAVVREAAGIVAYHAGEWTEALGDLRAARRMGGGSGYMPMMADIERALGRPERALDLTRGPEARGLDQAERIELLIVAAGARRDMGEVDAAVVGLQLPELDPARRDPWSPRLFYAYADNLLAAGRRAEAVQWFVHAFDADTERGTDAADRIAELTGEAPPGAESDDDEFVVAYEDLPAPPNDRADRDRGSGDDVVPDGPAAAPEVDVTSAALADPPDAPQTDSPAEANGADVPAPTDGSERRTPDVVTTAGPTAGTAPVSPGTTEREDSVEVDATAVADVDAGTGTDTAEAGSASAPGSATAPSTEDAAAGPASEDGDPSGADDGPAPR